ncbi:hypothetical protein ACTG9Q_14815 [Actinokineospora sp. 24-640]
MRGRVRAWAAVAVAGLSFFGAGALPASAFGAETFGCRIAPGTVFEWNEFCTNSRGASEYNVGFAVLNTSGTGYTYSWSISGAYRYVITGCTSTSHDCAVAVGRSGQSITTTVTYSQNGHSATKTAYATIEPWCGSQPC